MKVRFTLKSGEDNRDLVLGYAWLEVIMNLGPFPGGGDALVVRTPDGPRIVNSNDLIADLDGYEIDLRK